VINIDDVMAKLAEAAADGMDDAMQHLLTESRKLAPIEEGTLERSGTATTASEGDAVEGAVSYNTPYAVIQHEKTGYRHDAGRQAKYLEDPWVAEADTMGDIIATAMRKAID